MPESVAKITPNMTISEVIEKYPETMDVMMENGLHCTGCSANMYETLEQGFLAHGMSDKEFSDLIDKLNVAASKPRMEMEKGDIVITEFAVGKLKEIMEKSGKPGSMLRVGISPGGCSGFTYSMNFVDSKKDEDFVFDKEGLTVVIDKASMQKLNGLVIDYAEDLQGSGFKIENPNAEHSCGCGKSFH